jgi:hypothetical protein
MGQEEGEWSGDPQQWHLKLEFEFLFWTKVVLDDLELDSFDFDLDLERSFSDASELALNRESNLRLSKRSIAFSKVLGYSLRSRANEACKSSIRLP